MARYEYRPCRRIVDQGRPDQYGAFARGAAPLARSSLGGVHAERGSRDARRPPPAPRQVAGAPAHGAAPAGRALEPSEIRIWSPGASLAQASPALPQGGGGAADGGGVLERAVGSEFRRAWSLL